MNGNAGKANLGLIAGLIAIALIIGAFVRGGVARRLPGQRPFGGQRLALMVSPNQGPVSLGAFKNGFATVVDPALAAVVNISSTKVVKQPSSPNQFQDPFFRQFFGDQGGQGRSQREVGLGSGVVVNSNGYIVTNSHVVNQGADIEVFTPDHKKYKAKVIGADPRLDIAIVKIDATGLPTLAIGDSSKLQVGDLVFAIGDPFGIGETATTGIVSATSRGLNGAIEHYENFIQTDAAINPGNSGGALIDLHGNLVGINTAIISGGGGGNEGVGFAIPINMARPAMEQIVEHGKVIRGYLGVNIQGVDEDIAKAFHLQQTGGALVGGVEPNSPAAKAGVQRGDIVLALNGQKITSPDDLSIRISEMAPGAQATLQVFRDGQTRDFQVVLGDLDQSEARNGQTEQSVPNGPGSGAAPAKTLKGMQVQDITPDIARQLGIQRGETGVVITDVDPSSTAADAGLHPGDIIKEVNHQTVSNVEQYTRLVSQAGNQPLLLLLERSGVQQFVIVQPE